VLDKVDLHAEAGALPDHWNPRTVGTYNGDHVQVIRVKGEFVWHSHDRTDDLFLVLSGRVVVQLRDGDVELRPTELIVVPAGTEHCLRADEEATLMVLEHLGDVALDPLDALLEAPQA
jgi:mannose-6-phosphate isomerase-like protein (cupin superfamily)